jgi:parallel beta-helix repeat protein
LKKLSSLVLLVTVFLSVLTLAFNIRSVKADATIYILPDGTVTGTDKIQQEGDLYRFTDNINGSIMVERNNTIIDGMGFALMGSGMYEPNSTIGIGLYYSDFPQITISNVTIRDLTIKSFYWGICLPSSSNIVLSGNRITDCACGIIVGWQSPSVPCMDIILSGNNLTENWDGIYLAYSLNNTIYGNNIDLNNATGICSVYCDKNTIFGNTISENQGDGLFLDMGLFDVFNSSDNRIFKNNINNNGHFGLDLDYVSDSVVYENNVTGNSGTGINMGDCSNMSIYRNNVTSNSVGINLDSASNNSIWGNDLSTNGLYGIYSEYSSNNSIYQNGIRANMDTGVFLYSSLCNRIFADEIVANEGNGVCLMGASNCTVFQNNVTGNSYYGLSLQSSSNSIVYANNFTSNDYGIEFEDSVNCTVWGNAITENTYYGISLSYSSNDTIRGNEIFANKQGGIDLEDSANNTIVENEITANVEYGMTIYWSSNNSIYHNDFIENGIQVSTDGSMNIWNEGYPLGGNFWSDYNGTDFFHGPLQNEAGSDGIGDTPYVIDENNIDQYPLFPLHVWPNKGSNTGTITVTITGSGFEPGATVKLATRCRCIQIEGIDTQVKSPNLITTKFDLSGAEPRSWDVIITQPDGKEITMYDAFTTVEGGESKPELSITGRDRIRFKETATFRIGYGNKGYKDTYDATLWIKIDNLPNGTTIKVNGLNTPNEPSIDWKQVPMESKINSTTVIPIWIYCIPARSFQTVELNVLPLEVGARFTITSELWQAEPNDFIRTGNYAIDTGSSIFSTLTATYGAAKVAFPDLLPMSVTDFADNLTEWIQANQNQISKISYNYLAVAAITEILGSQLQIIPDRLIQFISNATSFSIDDYMLRPESEFCGNVSLSSFLPQSQQLESGLDLTQQPFESEAAPTPQPPLRGRAWKDYCMSTDFGEQYVFGKHQGIDIANTPRGDEIFPVIPGKVAGLGQEEPTPAMKAASVKGAYYIVIQDSTADHNYWIYVHLANDPKDLGLKVADDVGANTLIGKVDSTGSSTGDHLHIETWSGIDKQTINPRNLAPDLFKILSKCSKKPKGGAEIALPQSINVEVVSSLDPNDKAGPSGFGAQRFITSDATIPYVIFFENLKNATAPAHNVIVTDQLDPNLDWNTLNFGETSHPQNVTVYFNSTTGVITWNFTAIDLPPNVNPPEGEGWVTFTIAPKPDLPSGTQIRNKATVVFDFNAPISTPEFLNTIDSQPPSTKVNTLDPEQPLNFTVSWAGTDEAGSGIKDYTIYVSDNGGPYTEWLFETNKQSATFAGQKGHIYSFYSVATDNVGNTEQAHTQPDTTIVIDSIPPNIGTPIQNPQDQPLPTQSVTISVSVNDVTSGVKNVTLSYTIDNGVTWNDLPMSYNASTNLYEATIPMQPAGTTVKYKLTAYDNTDNQAIEDNGGQYYVYIVVPEFHSFSILLLLVAVTLLIAVAIRRRKRTLRLVDLSTANTNLFNARSLVFLFFYESEMLYM